MVTYSTIAFEQLTGGEKREILEINNQRAYPVDPLNARGYIFSHLDALDYLLKIAEDGAAQLFVAKDDGHVVGFLVLLCLHSKSQFLHRREVECSLAYVAPFLSELKAVGVAAYIDRIAVKDGIDPECGVRLARQALVWAQAPERCIAVMAGIIHYQNYYSLNFFRALKFRIIDFYDTDPVDRGGKTVDAIWLRLVRILRPDEVSKAIITQDNASILTKLRYAELADTIYPPIRLGKRWLEGKGVQRAAPPSPFTRDQVLWQGWHVHGRGAALHDAIPRAGFCDYRTIELLSDSIRRANSAEGAPQRSDAQDAMHRVGDALKTILALYRAREEGKRKSITTYLQKKRAWFVLTNGVSDPKAYHVHGCQSVVLNLNDPNRTNSEKVSDVFGGDDDCSSWLDAYRMCMAADLAVWKLHARSRGDVSCSTPEWIHVFGPTNWDSRLYTGVFTTRIIAGRDDGDEWANLLRDMYASATVMSDVILRLNAEILVHASRLSARAAIMSRNLSHNVGSHALANPQLHEAIGIDGLEAGLVANGECGSCKNDAKTKMLVAVKARLGTFHQYTQTRLDFIARALNPQTERPEPLFFFNDVLNGLFRQTVLLDTLLADRGFPMMAAHGKPPTREISFHVEVSLNGTNRRYSFRRDRASAARSVSVGFVMDRADAGIDDVLVGIPGGMIGSHALYSFVENLMRNAAKYGQFCNERNRGLEIHMRLRYAGPCDCSRHGSYYVLEAWDNLGDVGDKKAVCHIRHHMGQDVIMDDGSPQTSGHGIQEMKIAAEFLASRETFISDEECRKIGGACEYSQYLAMDDMENVPGRQPLRCFQVSRKLDPGKGNKESQRSLVYQMLVPKARLVGIVPAGQLDHAGDRPAKDAETIFLHESLRSLAREGAAFGVILDSGSNQAIESTVEQIRKHHHVLPYRLIILSENEKRREQWSESSETIRIMVEGYDKQPFDPERDLPVRRVHFLADAQLHHACLHAAESEPQIVYRGCSGWEAFTILLYHQWLKEFKGVPVGGRWNVLIGFERESGQVSDRWKSALMKFWENTDIELPDKELGINVLVRETNSTADSSGTSIADQLKDPGTRSSYLIFDNHSAALEKMGITDMHSAPLDQAPALYHDFSGSRELSLCQSLESPPQTPFTFAFWLYGLIEGSLLNVAILDERVGEACISDVPAMERLRVLPIFSVSRGEVTSWISPNVESDANGRILGGHLRLPNGESKTRIEWTYDSWACTQVEAKLTSARWTAPKGSLSTPIDSLDAIILHEGVIDVLPDSVWGKKLKDELKLLALAPRIFRSSGRGSLPRHLDKQLPFIEFSEVSETVYRSRNKPALGKAICSVSGLEGSSDRQGKVTS